LNEFSNAFGFAEPKAELRTPQATAPKPEKSPVPEPRSRKRGPGKYKELIDEVLHREPVKNKGPDEELERQQQQERERQNQKDRDRER
jgi:hypothetical protein